MLALVRHPDSRGEAVGSILVRAAIESGLLSVLFVLEGELERLRMPPRRAPRVGERLWEHTCCEVFVARKGSPAYREFNLSPSGEWAAFAFTGYRAGAPMAVSDPGIAVRRAATRLELSASIAIDAAEDIVLGLSAVTEDAGGGLAWWALRHAPGKPDFHHRGAFALELA